MPALNDDELDALLSQWQAPLAPPALAQAILQQPRANPLARLWRSHIQIPTPVALAAALALAALLFWPPPPKPQSANSLAGFEPIQQPKVRIIRSQHVQN
jgi:hypothetical protein